jgi:ribosomal protein L1
VSVILITGVLKGRSKFFLPYLTFAYFQLVLIILRTANKFLRERFLGDVDIAVTIVRPLIPLYFVICVHSYYVDVKKQQREVKETVVLPTSV